MFFVFIFVPHLFSWSFFLAWKLQTPIPSMMTTHFSGPPVTSAKTSMKVNQSGSSSRNATPSHTPISSSRGPSRSAAVPVEQSRYYFGDTIKHWRTTPHTPSHTVHRLLSTFPQCEFFFSNPMQTRCTKETSLYRSTPDTFQPRR